MNVYEVMTAISKLKEKDFQEVRHFILRMATTVDLHTGKNVKFDAKSRGIITGVIMKVNQKTVRVRTDSGVVWNVHKSLVQSAD